MFGIGPLEADLLLEQVASSPVLSDQSFAPGDGELHGLWSAGGWVNWLGGPAAATLDQWPRGRRHRAGTCAPLDLADLSGVVDDQGKAVWPGRREGLPTEGVLNVFHDPHAFGDNASDRDTGARLAR
jgi:hypothetical protein